MLNDSLGNVIAPHKPKEIGITLLSHILPETDKPSRSFTIRRQVSEFFVTMRHTPDCSTTCRDFFSLQNLGIEN